MPHSILPLRSGRRTAMLAALGVALAASAGRVEAQDRGHEGRDAQLALTGIVRELGREAAIRAAAVERTRQLRDSIVTLAKAQLGKRYRYGGETPGRGFDCSGLVQYVANALGIEVPRTAARQARFGAEVATDTSELRPGDLLTFGSRRRISHIGIYVGDGKFIHASSVAGRVIESPVKRPRAKNVKPWRGVRRLLVADERPVLAGAAPLSATSAAAAELAD